MEASKKVMTILLINQRQLLTMMTKLVEQVQTSVDVLAVDTKKTARSNNAGAGSDETAGCVVCEEELVSIPGTPPSWGVCKNCCKPFHLRTSCNPSVEDNDACLKCAGK